MSLCIDGWIITDDDEIRCVWADYYESLSNAPDEDSSETHILQYMRIIAAQNEG